MLYARGKNDDVASRVIFCALVGSALAIPLKYDNHLLGLVKVPRHNHPRASPVRADVPQAAFGSIHRTCLSVLVTDWAIEAWYYPFIA
jgi:hypothetical protein